MPLEIEIISYKNQRPDNPSSWFFDQFPVTVGRVDDNDLPLSDGSKSISRNHAVIIFESGRYIIRDKSVNGTYIRNRNIFLHDNKTELTDNDELQIGGYTLSVCITSQDLDAAPSIATNQDLMEDFDIDQVNGSDIDTDRNRVDRGTPLNESYTPPAAHVPMKPEPDVPHDPDTDASEGRTHDKPPQTALSEANWDPMELLGSDVNSQPSEPQPDTYPTPPGPESDRSTGVKDFGSTGGAVGNIGGEARRHPEHSGTNTESNVPPTIPIPSPGRPIPGGNRIKPPKPVVENPPALDADIEWFEAFLSSAGIQDKTRFPAEDIPKIMQNVGAVFKEMVIGLMKILEVRAEQKNLIRTGATRIQRKENNPFKHAPAVEDAIRQLMTNTNPSFLEAVEAARQGYNHIVEHQLGMSAGYQAFLKSMMQRFDPQQFEKNFQEGIVFQKKAKCWDSYSRQYPIIVERAIEAIFGEEFAHAYEQQTGKVRAASVYTED
jgi:type VI secretion system protein